MNLVIFNVEHGACALLTCDNRDRLMIDCGHNATTRWMPGDHLGALGVHALKMLVVTNYDEDHVSGLPNLTSKIFVQNLYRNPTVSPETLIRLKSESGHGPGVAKVIEMMRGWGPWSGPPQFPGVSWSAFWNPYPSFDDENNLSVVLHLEIGNVTFLFPGDLEKAGWLALLRGNAQFAQLVTTTGCLVASHHGRDSGICEELFDVYGCRPNLVVISDDAHQYDTQQTTAYYKSKASGIDNFRGQGKRWVLTTRSDGALLFTFNPSGGCVVS